MAKPIPCEIIFNTRWGYEMQPIKCNSIAEALREARERGMAFRIIVNDKVIRRGWFV